MSRNPHLRYELTKAFAVMRSRYGAEWDAKWARVAEDELLEAWAGELVVFGNQPQVFAWVLTHLPERAPNPMQFRRLADQAPRHPQGEARQGLPVRGPTPEERASLLQLRESLVRGSLFARPGTQWANALVERATEGASVSHAALRLAREVVDAQERRRANPPARHDVFDAHPSAMLADDEEVAA